MSIEAMPAEISKAVIAMMAKVGYIQKTGNNSFHNYKYVSIEDVLEKVQPALTDCGLVITQDEASHAIIAEGNLMEATYAFGLSHISGKQWGPIRHTGLASVRNSKGGFDDKALNKCHTAARKYFILGLFQIPTGLEADVDEEEDKPHAPAPRPQAAPQRTAAPQTKEGKTPVQEWVENQTGVIRALSSAQALARWEDTNEATLARLKKADPKAHSDLEALLLDMRAKLTRPALLDAAE